MKKHHTCPTCGADLMNSFERELADNDPRRLHVERTHAIGGAYLEREPIGIEVVGECPRHGLLRVVPLGIPHFSQPNPEPVV